MTLRLAVAQLSPEPAAVSRNLAAAREAVAAAADRDADLLLLPELWDAGYFAFDAYGRIAESVAGDRLTGLAERAADADLALLAGTVVEDLAASAADGIDTPEPTGLANTAVLFDADGRRRAIYRKHHLFGYESAEAELLEPGQRLETATVGEFTVGIATCYDLRFPEQFRALTDRGADLLCVPSAWPYPRVEHWRTLTEARAVENLSFLAAANGVGEQGDAELAGRSVVYDPWGTTLAAASTEPTVLTADLEPDRVTAVREEFDTLSDRRVYDTT
ncbi:nitrilase-related carbon-nitrogen hydrolase [Halobaculum sp. MBLA0143]|uniref:nitrilase-related carbon-nitrogen hydrolase n=1 Tax=Halobaculum sp. MBLA0143 TaxID=3079933 RepID=UPI00352465CB